jgi:hypothetical protein
MSMLSISMPCCGVSNWIAQTAVAFKMSKFAALLLLPLVYAFPARNTHDDLLVHTNLFSVQGVPWPNTTDVRFFGGIPYAEPPVGAARFRPPITKRPTNQTIDASWFGPSCIQYNNGQKTVYSEYLKGFLLTPGQQQSEDCLTLNIWAPRKSHASEPLPVMIWIHGGGFTSGGAASPYKYGDRLAKDHNVVVVALKYECRSPSESYTDVVQLPTQHLWLSKCRCPRWNIPKSWFDGSSQGR